MRYFLLDKVTSFEAGKRASGVKCVTLTEDILHDHFPDYPLLPGALLLESMSQLGGKPGDRILLEAVIESRLEGAARVMAEASVDGERVARSELTFVLRTID